MTTIIERLQAESAEYLALAAEVSELSGRPIQRVMMEAEERAHNANAMRSTIDPSLPPTTRLDMLRLMKAKALRSRNGHV